MKITLITLCLIIITKALLAQNHPKGSLELYWYTPEVKQLLTLKEASSFCNNLSGEEEIIYRLPTINELVKLVPTLKSEILEGQGIWAVLSSGASGGGGQDSPLTVYLTGGVTGGGSGDGTGKTIYKSGASGGGDLGGGFVMFTSGISGGSDTGELRSIDSSGASGGAGDSNDKLVKWNVKFSHENTKHFVRCIGQTN